MCCAQSMRTRAASVPVPVFNAPNPPTPPDLNLLKAAKFKAAEQAGREVNTQFFDHVSGSDHASFNPLALVLSYGEDDDDDDGEDEEFATPGRQDLGNSATESVEPDRAKKVDRTSVLSAASPDLLEGFFSELQSEGLLDGDDDDAAPAEALAQDNDGESATDRRAEQTETAGTSAGGANNAPSAAHPSADGDSNTQEDESSGIRLLRYVASGPWARVRDAATGRDFFWHSETKQSTWTLPEGVLDEGPELEADTSTAEPPQRVSVSDDTSISGGDSADKQQTVAADQPLANAPLPSGWREVQDAETGDIYFWCEADGAVQWERPVEGAAADAEGDVPVNAELDGHDAPNSRAVPVPMDKASAGADAECDAAAAPSAETARVMGGSVEGLVGPREAARGTEDAQARGASEDGEEGGWKEIVDEQSGDTYYWNVHTNRTTWTRPAGLDEKDGGVSEGESADGEDGIRASLVDGAPPETGEEAADKHEAGVSSTVVEGLPASTSVAFEDSKSAGDIGKHGAGRSALAEHAHASKLVASAMSAAAKGSALSTLLATAPKLLLLHAQLELRQRDLAALRVVLCNAEHTKCLQTRSAAAVACKHIAENVQDIVAELPDALVAAESMLESLPEEGEVVDEDENNSVRQYEALDGNESMEIHASEERASQLARDKGGLRLPSFDAEGTSTPPPLPEEDPSLPTADVLPEIVEADAPQTDAGQVPGEFPESSVDPSLESIKDPVVMPTQKTEGARLSDAPHVDARLVPTPRAEEVGLSEGSAGNATQPQLPPVVTKEVAHAKKRKGKSTGGALSSKRSKKGDALVSKWQTVAKTLEEEEAARRQPHHLLARERVKNADIEEWISQQFRTGEAQSNPNFIPLSVDWRARLSERAEAHRAAAEAAARSAEDASEAKVLHFDSQPDLELLGFGLPEGWQAMWDASSGDVYYGNVSTKVRASS